MKPTKNILLSLAGFWVMLLFLEKLSGTAQSFQTRKLHLPLRLGIAGFQLVKSLLIVGLVIANVFLAITWADAERFKA